METFFKKHWQTLLISALALTIIGSFVFAKNPYKTVPSAIDNPLFEQSGKWGIRFLLLSLAMTPLYTFFGVKIAPKIRKPAGLWAFIFALIHVSLYLWDTKAFPLEVLIESSYIVYGFFAFIILSLLALTSFRFVMKRMGHWWKVVHRLVYVAGILVFVHSITAALGSKRAFMGGQESARELQIYLVLMIVLLAVRLPFIKNFLRSLSPYAPQKRKNSSVTVS